MVVRADDRAGGAVRLAVAAASARVGPGQAGRRRVGQRAGQAAAGAAAMNGAAHRRQVPLKDKKNRFAFFCRIFILQENEEILQDVVPVLFPGIRIKI